MHIETESAPHPPPRWKDVDWRSAITLLAFEYTGKDALWKELPAGSYRLELRNAFPTKGGKPDPEAEITRSSSLAFDALFHHDVLNYPAGTPIALEAYLDCTVLERFGFVLGADACRKARSGRLIVVIHDVLTEEDQQEHAIASYAATRLPGGDPREGDRILDDMINRWPNSLTALWALEFRMHDAFFRGDYQLAAMYARQNLEIRERRPLGQGDATGLYVFRQTVEYIEDVAAGRRPPPDQEKRLDPPEQPTEDGTETPR